MSRFPPVAVLSVLSLFAVTACSKETAASNRDGSRLALKEPADQTVAQGASNPIKISVERTGFADAVSISFSNLPTGVRVEGDSIPAGESSKDFVIVAAPDAQVVNNKVVTVRAKASGIDTSQTFELTVKAK